ncbi:thiamine pyrophosphate-binding protein, partial [Actinoallomurus acaciae]
TAWVGQRPRPAADALREAADLITEARRPVLWLGNGCNRAQAGQAALDLAETLRAPVLTTFNGIGAVPTTHPLVCGVLSRMGTGLSAGVLREADLVIAVGNSLNAVSTSRWTLDLPRIVHIDVDPATIGRYYGDRTVGVVGDADATLRELGTALAGHDTTARVGWIDDVQRRREAWWRRPEPRAAAPLSPADIVPVLRDASPDETLLIPDAGNPGVWSYLWEVRRTGTYIKPVGFGNMGFAVPAAVAAAAIDPERPVLALVGDGSLGMTLAELETLVRVPGRVCVVVLNDAGYGNIRQEQIVKYGPRTIGVDFGEVDYARVAEGLGLRAARVTDLTLLAKGVGEALHGDRPVLFDVPIDPDVNAWTYPAFQTTGTDE